MVKRYRKLFKIICLHLPDDRIERETGSCIHDV